MRKRTAEEERRGCREHSKIYPVALEVVELFKSGLSYSQIAAKYVDLGITASMVAGHLDRNGIRREPKPAETPEEVRAKREKAEAQRKKAEERRLKAAEDARKALLRNALANIPKATQEAPEAPTERAVRPGAKPLLAMGSSCCWMNVGPEPKSPADQLFCGAKTNGGLFCEEHAEVAYQKREPRRRVAA